MKYLQGSGEAGAEYSCFARGWPPCKSTSFSVIKSSNLQTQRGEAIYVDKVINVASVDLSYQGADKSILTVGRWGQASGWINTQGDRLLFKDRLRPELTKPRLVLTVDQQIPLTKTASHQELAQEIMAHCKAMGIDPRFVIVDGTGLGGGTASHLKKYWGDVLSLDWATGASQRKILTDHTFTAAERYDGVNTELYFTFAQWLDPVVNAILINPIIGNSATQSQSLYSQLSSRRYRPVKGGRLRIESKPEYKARMQFSPDEGDSVVMLPHLIRMRTSDLPGMIQQSGNSDIGADGKIIGSMGGRITKDRMQTANDPNDTVTPVDSAKESVDE
jgi:hypothetical protein